MRLFALTLALHLAAALAQPWPAKPLKLVTPFPPGGSADVIARLIGQRLAENLGEPVVIENRQGAGGVVGNEYAARQAPDGYTLLLITGAYPVQAAMLKSLAFDPLADIAMVSMLTTYPFVISVRADSPFRTLAELITYAKAHPGKLNYPSGGVGTVHHLSGELLNAMAGIEIVHVAFRGGTGPLTEVLGGRVDLLLETMTVSLVQIRAGKLRPLAVTAAERWNALPDVPTVAETVPGYEVNSFIGLGTVGRTPEPLIERLNAEVRKALADSATHQRFVELGGAPAASTPGEMRAFVEHEMAKWKRVIRLRKIEQQ